MMFICYYSSLFLFFLDTCCFAGVMPVKLLLRPEVPEVPAPLYVCCVSFYIQCIQCCVSYFDIPRLPLACAIRCLTVGGLCKSHLGGCVASTGHPAYIFLQSFHFLYTGGKLWTRSLKTNKIGNSPYLSSLFLFVLPKRFIISLIIQVVLVLGIILLQQPMFCICFIITDPVCGPVWLLFASRW